MTTRKKKDSSPVCVTILSDIDVKKEPRASTGSLVVSSDTQRENMSAKIEPNSLVSVSENLPENATEDELLALMRKSSRLEDRLISVIMKYRNHQKDFFSVSEREQDRQEIDQLYEKTNTLAQKILDSRCYCEFGNVQQKQTIQFLAEDTTPQQRLDMIAYIVKTVRKPIVFLAGKSTLLGKLEEKKTAIEKIKEQPKRKPKITDLICTVKPISSEKIQIIRQQILEWLQNGSKEFHSWSISHAEILSQMASNHEVVIPSQAKRKEWIGTTKSMVLSCLPE